MTDDLMKLMGWLEVKPLGELRTGLDAYTFDDLVRHAQEDRGLVQAAKDAVRDIMPDRLWTPNDPLFKPISRQAATAPGSVRKNDFKIFFEKWDTCGSWTASGTMQIRDQDAWTLISSCFYDNPNRGVTISAASELEDEPAQPGFQATGPRDDFAGHMAYKGLKPGTEEYDAEARAWVQREEWKRLNSGEIMRASCLQVRDANLQRYRQSDADRLIEEMMT